MRNLFYFLIAALLTFGFQPARSDSQSPKRTLDSQIVVLDSATVSDINNAIPISITVNNGDEPITPEEIIRYLLSVLGGIITTIILAWLHKKFPLIFPSKKPRDYMER
jgi:hypothetical protein